MNLTNLRRFPNKGKYGKSQLEVEDSEVDSLKSIQAYIDLSESLRPWVWIPQL